jgi:hypothetical protein
MRLPQFLPQRFRAPTSIAAPNSPAMPVIDAMNFR